MIETPRFKVTSLTGFGSSGGNNAKLTTSYQVLDTAYCYELVLESAVRTSAERVAAALNAGDFDAARRILRRRAFQAEYKARFRQA